MRKNISSNTQSELRVGYSRAVHINNRVYVSGTTAVNEKGEIQGRALYDQTEFILNKILRTIISVGFTKKDIVSTTVYMTDMKKLPEFDKAFKKFFHNIGPTCTLVGVNNLVKKGLLVEIECIAEK